MKIVLDMGTKRMFGDFARAEPTFCCLHVALSDGNLIDEHVNGCYELSVEREHRRCIVLASKLLRMSKTQRGRVYTECLDW